MNVIAIENINKIVHTECHNMQYYFICMDYAKYKNYLTTKVFFESLTT